MNDYKIGYSLVLCVLTTLLMLNSTRAEQPNLRISQLNDLTDTNFSEWRDLIRTKDSELLWQQLPWAPSFHAGLAQAAELNKPLLLWVMNGHPMGCT